MRYMHCKPNAWFIIMLCIAGVRCVEQCQPRKYVLHHFALCHVEKTLMSHAYRRRRFGSLALLKLQLFELLLPLACAIASRRYISQGPRRGRCCRVYTAWRCISSSAPSSLQFRSLPCRHLQQRARRQLALLLLLLLWQRCRSRQHGLLSGTFLQRLELWWWHPSLFLHPRAGWCSHARRCLHP